MKMRRLFLIGLFLQVISLVMAEPPAGAHHQLDVNACKIELPRGMNAATEITAGPAEASKALEISIGDDDEMKGWEGKLSQKFSITEPGTYSLTFVSRVEPTDFPIELSVWTNRSGKSERISDRISEVVRTDWTEIHFVLVVGQAENDLVLSCTGLGRPGSTWFFSDFKLTKE